MKLPQQVAPVERSLTPAAISGQNGVEASFSVSHILSAIQSALPMIAKVVSSL